MKIVIYCHTHIESGKRYVGQSMHGMHARWRKHVSEASHSPWAFARAIVKYGEHAFAHEVLEEVTTTADANEAEARWISTLDCRVPNGYNLAAGGEGSGPAHPLTRAKMSATQKARLAKFTDEERKAFGRRAFASLPPEKRHEIALARIAAAGPDELRARGKRAWATAVANGRSMAARDASAAMSKEWRSERARRASAAQTQEQRSAKIRRVWEAYTPERRKEIGQLISAAKKAAAPAHKAPPRPSPPRVRKWTEPPPDKRKSRLGLQTLHKKSGTSRFRGVGWHKQSQKWRVALKINGVQKSLGLYDDEEHAARVYDTAARNHFGESALTNFPKVVT